MSSPPNSSACATSACGPSGTDRSIDTARTASCDASAPSSPPTSRAPAITRPLLATSAFAIARPMPLLAPVTTAILPFRFRSTVSANILQASLALDSVGEWDLDATHFAVDRHAVRPERLCRRTMHHGSGPHVELRPVQRAYHRRFVEHPVTQRTVSVSTFGLGGAEPSVDVEHGRAAQQQDRSRRHIADSKFVLLERRAPARCGGVQLAALIRNRLSGVTEPIVEPDLAEFCFVAGNE